MYSTCMYIYMYMDLHELSLRFQGTVSNSVSVLISNTVQAFTILYLKGLLPVEILIEQKHLGTCPTAHSKSNVALMLEKRMFCVLA
jgi:hypothetical protein